MGGGGGGGGGRSTEARFVLPVNEPKKMGSRSARARRAAKIKLTITKDDAVLYSLTLPILRNMFLTLLHGIGGQDAGAQIELLDTRMVL